MSKLCKHCGAEIQDNSVFCENCGKSLTETVVENCQPQKGEKRCKTCGEIYNKKIKFCPNCGVNSRQFMAAKLTNCKKCGHSIAVNAVKCPSCGKKTHYNFKITILVVGIFLFFIIVMSALLGSESDTSTTAPTDTSIETSTDKPVATEETVEPQDNILYSDDFFDIEYMKLYDVDLISTSYLQLKVANKSNQKVTLLLDDVYVNDIVIESGTAMPIELDPGKISTTPFILFTGNTGLCAEDITKIEFKLTARDDSFSLIHTTNRIVITK